MAREEPQFASTPRPLRCHDAEFNTLYMQPKDAVRIEWAALASLVAVQAPGDRLGDVQASHSRAGRESV